MKMRSLASFVLALLIFSSVGVAAYDDVAGSYAEDAVSALVEQGILSGEGSFHGGDFATRAFTVAMLVKGMGLEELNPEEATFSDLPSSHPAYAYIEAAAAAGLVEGDKGSENEDGKRSFRPEAGINRAELVKLAVLGNTLESDDEDGPGFSDVPAGVWFFDFVKRAHKHAVVGGYKDASGKLTGRFGPGDPVIRQDVAVVVYQAQQAAEKLQEKEAEEEAEEEAEDEVGEEEASEEGESDGEEDEEASVSDFAAASVLGAGESEEADEEASEDEEEEVDEGPSITFTGANHKGPFPAPEGIILKGTYGEAEFLSLSGDGPYQFKIQTGMQLPVACLDSSRNIIGSTGQAYDDGWYAGYELGKDHATPEFYDYKNDPKWDYGEPTTYPPDPFDDTPTGAGAGWLHYDMAYRKGYEVGYDLRGKERFEYDCAGSDVDVSKYNNNGWYSYLVGGIGVDGLTEIYAPPEPYVDLEGGDFNFDQSAHGIHKDEANKGEDAVNLLRIELSDDDLEVKEVVIEEIVTTMEVEVEADAEEVSEEEEEVEGEEIGESSEEEAAEPAVPETKTIEVVEEVEVEVRESAADYAKGIYEKNKKAEKKCVFGEAAIVGHEFAGNKFTELSYAKICNGKLKQVSYMFEANAAGDGILIVEFKNIYSNIADDSSNGINEKRLISAQFVKQFLEGVKYE